MSRRPPSARDRQKALNHVLPAIQKAVPGHLHSRAATPLPRPLPNRQATNVAGGVILDTLIKQGPAGVATNVFPAGTRVPANCSTSGFFLRCNPSHVPTGSDCTVDVKRAGSTVATVSIAAGSSSGSASTIVALAAGDLLTYDITSVGSTAPAYDIALMIVA